VGELVGGLANAGVDLVKSFGGSLAEAPGRISEPFTNRRRGRETQGYIDRIRVMLLAPGSDAPQDTLMHVKALMAEPRQAKSTR